MTPSPALRNLRNVALALAAGYCVGLVACQKPGTQVCSSGRYCPDGSQCAAAQDVCIFDGCGNGKLDYGEACDDGNILDGDGCSSTCGSNEQCGNGVWDFNAAIPEVCDWRLDPAQCSSDCLSNLSCGNKTIDEGEECDPVKSSPPVDTAYCTSRCTISRRGDGWVNRVAGYGPEQCDRDGAGNALAGPPGVADSCEWVGTVAGARIACNADCTWSAHGDGRVNPSDGEACDVDGVPLSSTAVRANCESGSCNANCTWSSRGDGWVNPVAAYGPEQCDRDGVGNAVAGPPGVADSCEWVGTVDGAHIACNSDCTWSVHGDGRVNPSDGEACDVDGVALSTTAAHASCESRTCNANCTWSSRGDGWVNPVAGYGPEQCDRDGVGNAVAGPPGVPDSCEWVGMVSGTRVACNADCTWSVHGDGRVNPSDGEACDVDGVALSTTAAHATCESRTCNWNCTWSSCGDNVRNPSATTPPGGEQCDDGHADDLGDCTASCLWNRCGDGIRQQRGSRIEQCDFGDDVNVATTTNQSCGYDQQCTFCLRNSCTLATVVGPYCGDGAVNGGGEACDSALSAACGTCVSCQPVWLRAAQGTIDVRIASSVITTGAGDTFDIDDGVTTVTLEFSDSAGNCTTTTATHACVNLSGAHSRNDIAGAIHTAMTTPEWASSVTASVNGSLVSLRHSSQGLVYNRPIRVHGSTLAVAPAQAAVIVSGMRDGTGCLQGAPCATDWDCIGDLLCTSGSCAPP